MPNTDPAHDTVSVIEFVRAQDRLKLAYASDLRGGATTWTAGVNGVDRRSCSNFQSRVPPHRRNQSRWTPPSCASRAIARNAAGTSSAGSRPSTSAAIVMTCVAVIGSPDLLKAGEKRYDH